MTMYTFSGEPIYAKLFTFWQSLAQFKTATRVTKHWNDVPPEEAPCIFQMQVKETPRYRKGFPTIWTCEIVVMIYVYTNLSMDPNVTPSMLLNPLVDAVRNAMIIDDLSNNACTLGGLVSHCAIEGPIQYFEGLLGDEAVATIPVSFLVSP